MSSSTLVSIEMSCMFHAWQKSMATSKLTWLQDVSTSFEPTAMFKSSYLGEDEAVATGQR